MILMKGFYLHPKGNGKPLCGFIRDCHYFLEKGIRLQCVSVTKCMAMPIYYYFTHCLRGPWYMITHYQKCPLSTFNNVSIILLCEMSIFAPRFQGGEYGNKRAGRQCLWPNTLFPPLFFLK